GQPFLHLRCGKSYTRNPGSGQPDTQDHPGSHFRSAMLKNGIDDLLARGKAVALNYERLERVLAALDRLNADFYLFDLPQQVRARPRLAPAPALRYSAVPDLSCIDRVLQRPQLVIIAQGAIV